MATLAIGLRGVLTLSGIPRLSGDHWQTCDRSKVCFAGKFVDFIYLLIVK